MRKNTQLSKPELDNILQKFYEYFSTGYKFEEFIKIYLEKLGLEEVFVTRRSNDGGIDLTAVRRGIGGFSQENPDTYFIQAKRWKPVVTISPEKIRALRGSFTAGKGIFITTARISGGAKNDALNLDPQKPIIPIDGCELIMTCIDMEIGFVFNPVFSKSAMDDITNSVSVSVNNGILIEKLITQNDIRTYTLPIPSEIKKKIPDDCYRVPVSFNGSAFHEYNIDAGKRYIAGIASIYKKYGLRKSDGAFIPQIARWLINDDNSIAITILD